MKYLKCSLLLFWNELRTQGSYIPGMFESFSLGHEFILNFFLVQIHHTSLIPELIQSQGT